MMNSLNLFVPWCLCMNVSVCQPHSLISTSIQYSLLRWHLDMSEHSGTIHSFNKILLSGHYIFFVPWFQLFQEQKDSSKPVLMKLPKSSREISLNTLLLLLQPILQIVLEIIISYCQLVCSSSQLTPLKYKPLPQLVQLIFIF